MGFRWFGGHEEGVLLLSGSLPGRLGSLVVISCCGGSLLNTAGFSGICLCLRENLVFISVMVHYVRFSVALMFPQCGSMVDSGELVKKLCL